MDGGAVCIIKTTRYCNIKGTISVPFLGSMIGNVKLHVKLSVYHACINWWWNLWSTHRWVTMHKLKQGMCWGNLTDWSHLTDDLDFNEVLAFTVPTRLCWIQLNSFVIVPFLPGSMECECWFVVDTTQVSSMVEQQPNWVFIQVRLDAKSLYAQVHFAGQRFSFAQLVKQFHCFDVPCKSTWTWQIRFAAWSQELSLSSG